MKHHLITLFFITTSLLADVTTQTTIDAQINAIKNATPSERVKLMNEFKIRVSKMNQEEQVNAITAMHSKMITRDHTSQMQIQESLNIVHNQNSNQHQAGDQIGSQIPHTILNSKSTNENSISKPTH